MPVRAAAAVASRPGGEAPGSAPAPGRGQRVRVPWRLVAGGHYSDAALAVYVKVAALAARPEGCTAAVATLAAFLGVSKPSVERALTELINPDPDDGLIEVPTVRRTLPGGRGHTALRRPRPLARGELYVWLPVVAADALPPRLLRCYAVLTYATARRIPTADADLAWHLRHHTGTRGGLPLTNRSVTRLTARLAAAGWITIHPRAGHQGRHLYTVHPHPLTSTTSPGPTDVGDGSGPDTDDGSLAIKEDRSTARRDEGEAGGDTRRRRDTPTRAPATPAAPSAPRAHLGAARRAAYTGPTLTLAPRIWHVLAPVRDLLPGIRPYVMRRIARDIGHQLDTYATADRLTDRLTARRAGVFTDEIRDPGRWLLGAALPRWGCGLTDCESGRLWPTGARCEVCAQLAADHRTGRARGRPPHTGARPSPAWQECTVCGAPSRRALPAGRCRPCADQPTDYPEALPA